MTVQDKGDLAGAETLYRQSLDMRRELLGPDHPEVGRNAAQSCLVAIRSRRDARGPRQHAGSARAFIARRTRRIIRRQPGCLNGIGSWLTMGGEDTEADVYLEEGLAMRRRLFNAQHPDVASSLIALAILRVDREKYTEALRFRAQRQGDLYGGVVRRSLAHRARRMRGGRCADGLDRYPEAEKPLTHGHAILVKDSGLPLIYRTLAQRYLDTLAPTRKNASCDATKQNAATP